MVLNTCPSAQRTTVRSIKSLVSLPQSRELTSGKPHYGIKGTPFQAPPHPRNHTPPTPQLPHRLPRNHPPPYAPAPTTRTHDTRGGPTRNKPENNPGDKPGNKPGKQERGPTARTPGAWDEVEYERLASRSSASYAGVV
ncbi:hypothetical protein SLNWT_3192 [Streptomyces albus]|uniref:Uncharacterized protein n=1 Tax=Streptomyces albus (strain ATCC 21838 / DSM 41398 / FERM P-419 / JCM 4703 / NBRC 107858) TaxID=1081613 RepID=A0A0B5EM96_STRA4|nr:hypothetical protein SLNWT_3192 [Streptomyces albus]AOU77876.1 hypothetical protein SLNHY_3185 [Streptomyces albus]